MTEVNLNHSYDLLYSDTCIIIEEARNYAYRAVNIALTLRNWQLGERIARENLDGAERAEYGKKIITELSRDLTNKYGKGFDRISLYNYLKFYRCFPEIVGSVSQQSQIVDAVSQQSENGASMRSQFGISDPASPNCFHGHTTVNSFAWKTLKLENGTNKKPCVKCGVPAHCIATSRHNTTTVLCGLETRK